MYSIFPCIFSPFTDSEKNRFSVFSNKKFDLFKIIEKNYLINLVKNIFSFTISHNRLIFAISKERIKSSVTKRYICHNHTIVTVESAL